MIDGGTSNGEFCRKIGGDGNIFGVFSCCLVGWSAFSGWFSGVPRLEHFDQFYSSPLPSIMVLRPPGRLQTNLGYGCMRL